MKTRYLKVLATFSLSVLLTYSGAAWALDDCLNDNDEIYWGQDTASSTGTPQAIHCVTPPYEIEGILQSSTATSVTESRKVIGLKSPVSIELTSFRKIDPARKSPYLDWFISASPPGALLRRFLLSVFLL